MEAKNENVEVKPSGNRVVDDLMRWQVKEGEMKKTFGDDIVNKRHFTKEKYAYFQSIVDKYRGTKNPEERAYLNVAKGEMKDIQKIAIPNKYARGMHNAMELFADFILSYERVVKNIAKLVQSYIARKREQTQAPKTDEIVLETKRQFEKAVQPLLKNGNEKVVGPDRDQRRNNTETERNKDEKVRYIYENDIPLIPKKKEKGQTPSDNKEALLPKHRANTGKGVKI